MATRLLVLGSVLAALAAVHAAPAAWAPESVDCDGTDTVEEWHRQAAPCFDGFKQQWSRVESRLYVGRAARPSNVQGVTAANHRPLPPPPQLQQRQ